MGDKELFGTLTKILDGISESEYPEICKVIRFNIDTENETVYVDAETIADQLYQADGAKQLPARVGDFLLKVYKKQMNEGNADAACNIGALYYTGRIGEQSYKKAVKYYMLAAEGGCRQAQENLGYCYYYGRNVKVDYEKAFHYFALGAFDGQIRSLYKIGDMYRSGYYVQKNEAEAFQIYRRCEESMTEGEIPLVGADVMMRMGDCWFLGIGTNVDYKEARIYYQNAERMFFERLECGDFLIRECYDRVIARQEEIRNKLDALLPPFEWINKQ